MRLEGGALFIAPVAGGPWSELGRVVESVELTAAGDQVRVIEEIEALRPVSLREPVTLSFTGRIRPALFRVLYGYAPLPRRRVRLLAAARRRARARRGRR